MSGSQWVECPAGQWTQVSTQPAPLGFIYVWSRDGGAEVRWRRYQETPPFFSEDSAVIQQGKNTWFVPPAFINTWWFNPVSTFAVLRLS